MYWSFVNTAWKDEFVRGDFILVLQHSGERLSELTGIAHVDDFIKSEEDKQLFDLVFKSAEMARNYVMPPGVPMDRVEAMRKAFMDTMADPGFVASAKKMDIELKPVTGKDVAMNWQSIARSPAHIIEKAKRAMQTLE